ncbi:aKG-HExxH-type peptide beta-hydroxylase [Pseudanabaena sp. PCC 6802]|uniref:aKG-HExxH-type peptide beta-hydroxylase n=1 Tax=Pseudanabaena sp. PCC 6802 TaxID=118173 RepID=UPI000349316B|nr:HEXXH motif-containing putative peptide modification protein [Pseudanabaena sp. PCC 6802]
MQTLSPEIKRPVKEVVFSSPFLSLERVAFNIAAIENFASQNGHDSNTLSAWDTLRFLQHQDLPLTAKLSINPETVWFCGDSIEFASAVKNLMGNVPIPINHAFNAEEIALFQPAYNDAISRFSTLFPELFASFVLLIRYVIFARRDHYSGGTVSSRIGLIWLSPNKDWSDDEWLENIIHEFVHNALFFEDLVHCIFLAGSTRLEEPDALATSAIRQVKRGYDKSYHSAFVSQTIIEYYLAVGQVEKAASFIFPLVVCVEDLAKNTKLVSEHGKELLMDLCIKVLEKYSMLSSSI